MFIQPLDFRDASKIQARFGPGRCPAVSSVVGSFASNNEGITCVTALLPAKLPKTDETAGDLPGPKRARMLDAKERRGNLKREKGRFSCIKIVIVI